jgi:pimeloyl-ACP methyl ester carboxylesterase
MALPLSSAARPAHGSASQGSAPSPRRYSRVLLALPFLPLLFLAVAPTVYNELRATAILLEIGGAPVPAIADVDTNPVVEEVITFPSLTPAQARVVHPARIYHPIGIAHPSPVVVIHGVHHLGMNEPRLMRFAYALASHGYLVLTPQVEELADYSITKNSALVIGDAVHELVRRSGAPKVGLLGLSLAGGMALIAASDGYGPTDGPTVADAKPAVGQQLSAVIAIGAHDDLRRVLDFYESDQTRAPDGTELRMKANEYGQLVVVYSHALAFFSPADVPQARLALRSLLWENLPQAHAEAANLSPQGQLRMAQLFAHDTKSLDADIQRGLAAVQPELDAASPHFYLSQVHVPVLLLHGAGDNVVPPTETLWLARDLPPGVLKGALITPAIGHVELSGTSWHDRWRLVQWIEQMLGLLDTSSAERD